MRGRRSKIYKNKLPKMVCIWFISINQKFLVILSNACEWNELMLVGSLRDISRSVYASFYGRRALQKANDIIPQQTVHESLPVVWNCNVEYCGWSSNCRESTNHSIWKKGNTQGHNHTSVAMAWHICKMDQ